MNLDKLYTHISKLYEQIYPQPEDAGHTAWAKYVIDVLCPEINTVLDVGCGTGFCQPLFTSRKIRYMGCTLGITDLKEAGWRGRKVVSCDMSDLNFPDGHFDMIFARHTLEHSPMPIITLMEWKRVSKQYLLLVMPAPEYWTYRGVNHYSVANKEQLWHWFNIAGWEVLEHRDFMTSDPLFMEYYLPEQKDRSQVKYPGAPIPVEYWFLLEAK